MLLEMVLLFTNVFFIYLIANLFSLAIELN